MAQPLIRPSHADVDSRLRMQAGYRSSANPSSLSSTTWANDEAKEDGKKTFVDKTSGDESSLTK